MMQREARVANPEADMQARTFAKRRHTSVVRNWEGSVLVIAVIAIIALGFIGGLNSVMAWFR
jgi:hypothetical protein